MLRNFRGLPKKTMNKKKDRNINHKNLWNYGSLIVQLSAIKARLPSASLHSSIYLVILFDYCQITLWWLTKETHLKSENVKF